MNVDDFEGTPTEQLNPVDLSMRLLQAASDLEKRARELTMAPPVDKRDAAQRLTEKIGDYLSLCDRHNLVRWDIWERVGKLQALAKNFRELGETAEADRYAAQAQELIPQCFTTEPG